MAGISKALDGIKESESEDVSEHNSDSSSSDDDVVTHPLALIKVIQTVT